MGLFGSNLELGLTAFGCSGPQEASGHSAGRDLDELSSAPASSGSAVFGSRQLPRACKFGNLRFDADVRLMCSTWKQAMSVFMKKRYRNIPDGHAVITSPKREASTTC